MIRFISLLVSIPVIIVIAAFAYRNAQLIEIDFFTVQYQIPLAAVILITLLAGVTLGFIVNIFVLLSQRNKIRQLKKQRETLNSLSDVLRPDK
ncbi:MAG: LapA family protein [Gammaproteobacteria bacterium]|nr:LapA family protein [Gammaproteobacteria bacterium]